MAIIVVVLREYLIFQIMLMAFSIIAAVIISGAVPYNRVSKRRMEFFNEVIIMFVLYNMICFSQFVPDLNARQLMGYFCCFVVASHLLLNLYIILSTSVNGMKVNAMLWLAHRRLAKQKARNSILIKKRKRIRHQALNDLIEEESPDAYIRERKQIRNWKLEPIEEEEVSSESESEASEIEQRPARYQINQELLLLEDLVNGKDSLEEQKIEDTLVRGNKFQKTINPGIRLKKHQPVLIADSEGASQMTDEHDNKFKKTRNNFNEIEEILDLDFDDQILKAKQQRSRNQKAKTSKVTIEEEVDEWQLGYQHLVKKNQIDAQRTRNMSGKLTEQEKFEQIIEDTEERFWKLYGDPDIEQLPNKPISYRK